MAKISRFMVVFCIISAALLAGCEDDPSPTDTATADATKKPSPTADAGRPALPSPTLKQAERSVRRFIAAVRDGDRQAILKYADMNAIAEEQRPPQISRNKEKTRSVIQEVLSRLMDPESSPTKEIAGSRVTGSRPTKGGVLVKIHNGKVEGRVLTRKKNKLWRIVKINP